MRVTAKQVRQARARFGEAYVAALAGIFGPGVEDGFELDTAEPRFLALRERYRRQPGRRARPRPQGEPRSDRPAIAEGPLDRVQQAIADLLAAEREIEKWKVSLRVGVAVEQVGPAVAELLRMRRVTFCEGCGAKLRLA